MSTAQRDCDHGSLARACIVCELQADLTASQARIKELESTVTGLSQACTESERDKEYNAGLVFEWRHKANAAEDALATSRALCDEIRQSGFRSIARADKAEAERNDAVDDLFRYKAASCFKGHAVPPFKCALCEVDRLKAELARRDDLAKMYKIVLADRDRLAGVVERVKDLHRWLKESGTHANEALNLGNVLADPVSETFTRLNSYGVPYESRNGRGLTGHDARGRRHEDTRNCVRYTPLTWDRRKANRRA